MSKKAEQLMKTLQAERRRTKNLLQEIPHNAVPDRSPRFLSEKPRKSSKIVHQPTLRYAS